MVFVSFATAGVNVASARLAAQEAWPRQRHGRDPARGCASRRWAFGTAAIKRLKVLAGRARGICCTTSAETALLILAPSLPAASGQRGAVLFGCAAGAAEHHGAAHRTAGADAYVAAAGLRVLAQWGAGYAPCCWATRSARASPAALCWLCRTHAGICTPARCAAAPHTCKSRRHPVARRGQPPAGL